MWFADAPLAPPQFCLHTPKKLRDKPCEGRKPAHGSFRTGCRRPWGVLGSPQRAPPRGHSGKDGVFTITSPVLLPLHT